MKVENKVRGMKFKNNRKKERKQKAVPKNGRRRTLEENKEFSLTANTLLCYFSGNRAPAEREACFRGPG